MCFYPTPKHQVETKILFHLFTGGEKLLYLDIPLLILILCNCIFYLMTAFHVWRLNLGTAVLDPAAAGKHKKR